MTRKSPQSLPVSRVRSTTSEPSIKHFRQVYGEPAEGGVTEILSIHNSSELSTTADLAHAAATAPAIWSQTRTRVVHCLVGGV
ncbi:MAG: DegV family protein [Candidatus Promineifilaceae bacterium]